MKKIVTTLVILYSTFFANLFSQDSSNVPCKVLGFGKLHDIAISPDSKKLASASSAMIVIWDLETGDSLKTLSGNSDYIRSISWSPDSKILIGGSNNGTIFFWNISSGKIIRTIKAYSHGYVWSVSCSPKGNILATVKSDKTIKIWDISSGKEIITLKGHTDWIWSVSWSPDGKRLASVSADKTIKIWDISRGKAIRTLEGHTDDVGSVAWSPDGKKLASGSLDNTIKLWDIENVKELMTLKGYAYSQNSVSWSPDGSKLASGSLDMTIRIWDATSGKKLKKLEGHTKGIHSVSWSPDGTKLVSGSGDGTIRIWYLEPEEEKERIKIPPIALSFSGVFIPIIVREYEGVQSTNKNVDTYLSPEMMLKVNVYDRFSFWVNYTKPFITSSSSINEKKIFSEWNGNAFGFGIGYNIFNPENRWGLNAYLGWLYYDSKAVSEYNSQKMNGRTIWRAFSIGAELTYRPIESFPGLQLTFRPTLNYSLNEDLVFNISNNPIIIGHSLANINLGVRYTFDLGFTSESKAETEEIVKREEIEEVNICDQIWMKKNLDVEHYRNGDSILYCETQAEWKEAYNNKEGAWCYCNNDSTNGRIYGRLYNWYAVNDSRGLAPEGWHVSTFDEWTELVNCLGGKDVAGGKLKEAGTTHWNSPNTGATNESGFTALPGGACATNGNSGDNGIHGNWWVLNKKFSNNKIWSFYLNYKSVSIKSFDFKDMGFSVRCVKD
ncbi:MAG: FISUMP domain-containing protein [bacterium]